jgi:hypothetical protein
MTTPEPQPDQGNDTVQVPASRDEARRWLDEAARFLARTPTMDTGAKAAVCAQLGTGYAVLAAVEARAPKPIGLGLPEGADPALLDALTVRGRRSDVEARPHDDERPGEPEPDVDGALPLAVEEPSAEASKPGGRRKPAAKAGEALRG